MESFYPKRMPRVPETVRSKRHSATRSELADTAVASLPSPPGTSSGAVTVTGTASVVMLLPLLLSIT